MINIIKNAAESIESNGEIHIKTSLNPFSIEVTDTGTYPDGLTRFRITMN
ncbi:hypothetical protein LJC52_04985 [Bacteroidales bacterium OttesenSCG-928-A17]|nr:hypothetical protein [Bacteroidales bacterium OttesenSCG-928-A17]